MAKKVQDPTLGMDQNENPTKQFDAKKMLEANAPTGKEGDKGYVSGTKIKYNDRLKVEILVDTRFYKAGQVVNPHKVKGQALIDQGIAKKYTEED